MEPPAVDQFIFDGLIKGFVLLLSLAIVWHPIGGIRQWITKLGE